MCKNPEGSFQKIWNPDVQIQVHTITLYDDMDRTYNVDQYFFFDSRNKINLVYPNYEDKLDYIKIVELLAESSQILQPDYNIFKKITMHSY